MNSFVGGFLVGFVNGKCWNWSYFLGMDFVYMGMCNEEYFGVYKDEEKYWYNVFKDEYD